MGVRNYLFVQYFQSAKERIGMHVREIYYKQQPTLHARVIFQGIFHITNTQPISISVFS